MTKWQLIRSIIRHRRAGAAEADRPVLRGAGAPSGRCSTALEARKDEQLGKMENSNADDI